MGNFEHDDYCEDCGQPVAFCECEEELEETCPDCGCHGMICTCYDDFEEDWDQDLDENCEEEDYDCEDW